jgi:hypothetical protein
MSGDDLFALMTALGLAVDQPSFAPRAGSLFHIVASAILTRGPLEITSSTDSGRTL